MSMSFVSCAVHTLTFAHSISCETNRSMDRTLFDFNHHVLPGDVLLLRSAGLRSLVNRAGQRAMRLLQPLRNAEFTHVALVVNSSHIADAMPGEGVRIRSWSEAASTYDLDCCKVARHPALMDLAHDPARLLARVQFYYAQRYALRSLANRTVQDRAGIVCSQFVVLVLHDLGLPTLVPTAMRALPSDIDHGTRDVDGWRQFSFTTYGWHPAVPPPPVNDHYWAVLASSLRSVFSTADANVPISTEPQSVDETAAVAGHYVADSGKSENVVAEQMLESPLLNGDIATLLSEAIGSRIASSMATTEAFFRITAEFDRQVLAICEALNNDHFIPQREQALMFGETMPEDGSGLPGQDVFSGQSLLNQWHAHFINTTDEVPKVLADVDIPLRLARHRVLLGKQVDQLTKVATERNDQAQAFQKHWDSFVKMLDQGHLPAVDLLTLMHRRGELLINGMAWLETDSADTIISRLSDYQSLASDTLPPRLPKLGNEAGAQAFDQILALAALDEQRMKWVSESRPILVAQTDGLASLLEEYRVRETLGPTDGG